MKKHWLVTFAIALGAFAHGALAQTEPREPQFPRDVHGLWWNPVYSGWATTVFDHQAAMSSALLIYDFQGNPTWYFAPRLDCFREGTPQLNANCLGPMYHVTGPWFGEAFRSDQVRAEVVGEWEGWWSTPLFAGVGPNVQRNLFLTYTVNGHTVRAIPDAPLVVQTIDPEVDLPYYDTSRSGLWGVPSESGWGIGLFQQGNRVAGTLFVHDRDNQPRWYVVNLATTEYILDFDPERDRFFEGEVFVTRGQTEGRVIVDGVTVRRVGNASLQFGATDDGGALLRYNIDGVQVTKTIHRLQ